MVLAVACNGNGAHVYEWGAWTVTTAATCTTDGVETRTCQNGSTRTETRPVAALGHNWSAWAVTTPATTTSEGVETRTCARCADTETRIIPQLEPYHWGDWVVTTPATCTTAGAETRTCQNVNTRVEIRTLAALGHSWGAWVITTPPTTTAEGVETRTCARCNDTETRAMPPITYNSLGLIVEIVEWETGWDYYNLRMGIRNSSSQTTPLITQVYFVFLLDNDEIIRPMMQFNVFWPVGTTIQPNNIVPTMWIDNMTPAERATLEHPNTRIKVYRAINSHTGEVWH